MIYIHTQKDRTIENSCLIKKFEFRILLRLLKTYLYCEASLYNVFECELVFYILYL